MPLPQKFVSNVASSWQSRAARTLQGTLTKMSTGQGPYPRPGLSLPSPATVAVWIGISSQKTPCLTLAWPGVWMLSSVRIQWRAWPGKWQVNKRSSAPVCSCSSTCFNSSIFLTIPRAGEGFYQFLLGLCLPSGFRSVPTMAGGAGAGDC